MKELSEKRFFVLGGAGFVGSHLVDRALSWSASTRVTVFDNFSSGRRAYLDPWRREPRLRIVEGDAEDRAALAEAMKEHDLVVHLASNPDLAKAQTDPDLDFRDGTLLTRNVLEAMRTSGTREIWFASGAGVYGDRGSEALAEEAGPFLPVSPNGASQLASEALISAYQAMFGWRARIFRFSNIVGPRQTHGVARDFLRKLRENPAELDVLGDGHQSKSYLYIEDALEAMWLVAEYCSEPFTLFNVAGPDRLTVKEIAQLAAETRGISEIKYNYGGERAGWRGDVPIVQLDTSRLISLGWKPQRNSRQAIVAALKAIDAAQ